VETSSFVSSRVLPDDVLDDLRRKGFMLTVSEGLTIVKPYPHGYLDLINTYPMQKDIYLKYDKEAKQHTEQLLQKVIKAKPKPKAKATSNRSKKPCDRAESNRMDFGAV